MPSLWGAGCLTHVPRDSAPPAAASAVDLAVQSGSDPWMCPDLAVGVKRFAHFVLGDLAVYLL